MGDTTTSIAASICLQGGWVTGRRDGGGKEDDDESREGRRCYLPDEAPPTTATSNCLWSGKGVLCEWHGCARGTRHPMHRHQRLDIFLLPCFFVSPSLSPSPCSPAPLLPHSLPAPHSIVIIYIIL